MPNHSRDSAPVRAGVYTRISWDPPGKGAGVERQRVDCEALCASREPLRAELEWPTAAGRNGSRRAPSRSCGCRACGRAVRSTPGLMP